MKLERIDHLVLTVQNIGDSCKFYSLVLGMEVITFGEGRKALRFGQQKINLHQKGKEFLPNAKNVDVGTLDICFVTNTPLEDVKTHLQSLNIELESEIVKRSGAIGSIRSLYLRDPDGNLLEISNY